MMAMNGMAMMLRSMGIDVDKLQEPVMRMAAGVQSIEQRLANLERGTLENAFALRQVLVILEEKNGRNRSADSGSTSGSADSADGSGNRCNPGGIGCASCNGGSASCDCSSGVRS